MRGDGRREAGEGRFRNAVVLIVLGSVSLVAKADTIVRRDGQTVDGVTVVEDTDQEVKYSKGAVNNRIPSSQIREIVYEAGPEFAQAEALEDQEDLAGAAQAFLGASEKAARPLVKLMVLVRSGEVLYRQGKFADARSTFAKAASIQPGARLAGLASVGAAQCDFMEGKLDAAKASLDRIPSVGGVASRKDCLKWYWTGRVLAQQDKPSEAVNMFKDAASGARSLFPDIAQRAAVRQAWVEAREKTDAVDRLLQVRDQAKHPEAQAEFFSLLAREYLKQAEKAKEGRDKQEAQAMAAFYALRVVEAQHQSPEALAVSFRVAAKGLSDLRDPGASRIEEEAKKMSEWMKTPEAAQK